MRNYAGPLYEINLVINDEVLAEAEDWLQDIVGTGLTTDGVDDARVFDPGKDRDGRSVRSCQFQARDDNALDTLLDSFFADIDAEAASRFGDQVIVHSRTLRPDHAHELPPGESPTCLNCGTRLRGQYCGSCGQRSRSRLISIWQLMREAFGDLFELDSRLWKTLIPLLIRPGQLTRDYLEGRRARYMPPFRTYLVLSVVFFVVVFFDPQKDLSLFFEPEPPPTIEETAAQDEAKQQRSEEKQAQLDAATAELKELEVAGKIDKQVVDEFENRQGGLNITLGGDSDDDAFFGDCSKASISGDEDFPDWFKKRFTDERVKEICERNNKRGIDNFQDAIVDKIPVALIVLLPLMAMVLKVLYPLSRRYFVEHLLFFVHFHAFFFLILTLQVLFSNLLASLSLNGDAGTLVIVAASFYIPVYLYKAMRKVYGQGHLITIFKYLILLITYLTGVSFTLLGALVITLFSA
ncbi:MAG TPA: DUF4286 family protein [Woeseiaceae bacterium]|nr:DUF4286 family protein [Woeseiaceae bacterium]